MTRDRSLDVVITGMAGRFPGASSMAEFRRAVVQGRSLTTDLTVAEVQAEGVPRWQSEESDFVASCGLLADAFRFDHAFFGFSERDALLSDPQHRLSLEVAWQALEDASRVADRHRLVTAVFSSGSSSAHARRLLGGARRSTSEVEQILLHSERDFLATLISHKLGLTGQAMTVLTACSSSLVAVHLAMRALNAGECDQAVVTAASVASPQGGHTYVPGGVLSQAGRCRPFDEYADGTTVGSGAMAVVLRRYQDAVEDGDPIHATILGSAVNNDGADKPGFTAPSVRGQVDVIDAALTAADVEADTIGFLESHGTGTRVGDPLEWRAAQTAYANRGARDGAIGVGAVKGNVGHLDVAAGLAGLISAVLTLEERVIPPVCGLRTPNPLLEPNDGPLWLPFESMTWRGDGLPRAAVTSLGVGGTNVHVILEAAPVPPTPALRPTREQVQLIPVSARDAETLTRSCETVSAWVEDPSRTPADVADLAFTQRVGRVVMAERCALLVHPGTPRRVRQSRFSHVAANGRPVLLFPGQGTQRPGMARSSLGVLPSFDRRLDQALDACPDDVRQDVRGALLDDAFPADGLTRTDVAQPALFTFEWALALALQDAGVRPAALVGHSLGEVVAACVAGVFDLPTAAMVVAVRGRLMQACPPGVMVALGCDERQARTLVEDSGRAVGLAAVNAPSSSVVGGEPAEVQAFLDTLPAALPRTALRTSHAFHTASMASAVAGLERVLATVVLSPPSVPYASNLTGKFVDAGDSVSAALFTEQLRRPVQFATIIENLDRLLPGVPAVEVGPGRVLSALLEVTGRRCVPIEGDSGGTPWDTLGQLWATGAGLDLDSFATGRRIHAPVYPFRGPKFKPDYPDDPIPDPSGVMAVREQHADPMNLTDSAGDDDLDQSVRNLVADAWREQLGDRAWSDDDDFVALGGDSLTAVRLAHALSRALDLEVPVRRIMESSRFDAHLELAESLLVEQALADGRL